MWVAGGTIQDFLLCIFVLFSINYKIIQLQSADKKNPKAKSQLTASVGGFLSGLG